MCLCIYVFICLQSDESEREGDKSLEGNLIALKNVVICLHDQIILYLPLNIGKQNITTEDDINFLIF